MQHFAPSVVPNGHDPTRSDTNRVDPTMNIPPPDYEPPSISSIAPRPRRDSLPVRAAKATASKSPWIVIGGVVVEVLRLLINHFG
jgi:hypothetical protein